MPLLVAPAARADDGVTYSPGPGFAGSTEQFNACGFQQAETVDLSMDGVVMSQAVADTGCVHITQPTSLDIAPTTHLVSVKGRQSGVEQAGVYVVAEPLVVAAPTVPGGSTTVLGQFFAPGRSPLLIPSDGHILPAPAMTDQNGGLIALVSVLTDTPPGAYPILIRDDPWLRQPPPLLIVVNAPRSADGNWILNVTSTLTRDSGSVTANGLSTINAPFTVTDGNIQGMGTLDISLDMHVADANCHGQSQVPFAVGGTQDSGTFHLVLSGVGASAPVAVTCNNGLSLPFALPAGVGSEPFDIAATDGTTIDLDAPSGTSNPFVTVPQNFSGHTHIALTRGVN
jgi:hypothetical protein